MLVLIAIALIAAPAGCSKEKKRQTEVKTTPIEVDVPAELRAAESLLKFVPENAYGFFHWNSTHPAYRRLASSPWAGGGAFSLDSLTSRPGEEGKFIAILKRAGIDPTERETYETLLSEAVAFASPPPSSDEKPALALMFRASDGTSLETYADNLKEQLKRAKVTVHEHEIEGGSAFSFDHNELAQAGRSRAKDSKPRMRYVGWSGPIGAIATKLWPIQAALSRQGTGIPKNVDSPQFKESVAEFPPAKHRYAIGYIDIAALLEDVKSQQDGGEVIEDTLNLKLIPFKSVALSMAMDDAPSNMARLLYEVKDPQHKKWFRALHSSSNAQLINSIPSRPLIFLSVDGQTLKDLRHLTLEGSGLGSQSAVKMLSSLDSVSRIALFTRIAPIGQSILPIPDLLMVLESSNPSELRSKLENLLGSLASGTGVSTGGWQEKELHGASVKFIRSQLGVGAYLAIKDNSVIVSSTEPMIRSVLEGLSTGKASLAKSVSSRTQQALAKDDSLGSLYIDFQEVGSFLENMGGMLSMYAPQNDEAKKFLSPESIANVKKMGAVVGSIKVDDNSISIVNFYEAASSGRS